jgi:carbamoyl-phosphate synthase large subunit
MPKRTDIKSILIIGSGPIVIGQACEFDYSGTQACKTLRQEGYKIILLNSNPATIMTDPEIADRTYVEPITTEVLLKIIEKEHPDAILPTLGGQTALNTALSAWESGELEKHGVELIGAKAHVIRVAEDRVEFKECMRKAGIECLNSKHVVSVEEAVAAGEELGYPVIVRPSFTLGGTGGGTAHNREELEKIAFMGLQLSLNHSALIEESVIGWKEFELEVMRDCKDNCVIVCSIENIDPMGIHTGDSVTIAPVQTLTDREYQKMRDWGIKVLRAVGVETGGSNVQFAMNPKTGRMVVIEMNPRVSRSSALASKATGFPIAKIAAKLAVGYTLDEIPNDITRETPACFEPTLDYVVIKIPRFAFEKFRGAEASLGVSMKSVGETMAFGTNFQEAYQKALRGLEIGVDGFDLKLEAQVASVTDLDCELRKTRPDRHALIKKALKNSFSIETISELTGIDPWFIDQFAQIVELEHEILSQSREQSLPLDLLKKAKKHGFSDKQIAVLRRANISELQIRAERKATGLLPVYRLVDTCAGEFEAYTPYLYSSYQSMDQSRNTDKNKVIILGSGPNRIGQGIEFDYCCVHTVQAARELGFEAIMINNNPETVSTDYDTSDKLYFEPLSFEDVMNIYENEKPLGIILQMGGQTPLNLAIPLLKAGCKVLGTMAESIDIAEDRRRCRKLLNDLGLQQPESDTVMTLSEAYTVAQRIGYPVIIRPSYVIGGRAMMIAENDDELESYVDAAFQASPDFPVLIDRYLKRAIEVDVDVLCDGNDAFVAGIMQHIEAAGVHSGDSACVVPPHSLSKCVQEMIDSSCKKIALALSVKGLLNVQFAVQDENLFVIEINPRASRTAPYLSKATGIPIVKIAAKIALGKTLKELGISGGIPKIKWFAVKEAVLPFARFPGVDPTLGPEMKSTGEVMGIDISFEAAYWKSQIAAGQALPLSGNVFVSARDADKNWTVEMAIQLAKLGFAIFATNGTANAIEKHGVKTTRIKKLAEQSTPNVIEMMHEGKLNLVINTPSGLIARIDEIKIRHEAVRRGIPIITTEDGARATVSAIRYMRENKWDVKAIQDYY